MRTAARVQKILSYTVEYVRRTLVYTISYYFHTQNKPSILKSHPTPLVCTDVTLLSRHDHNTFVKRTKPKGKFKEIVPRGDMI